MQDNSQKQSPMFAEVQVQRNGQMNNQTVRPRKESFHYIKVTYPNGVTLTIPEEIGADKLESFIKIKV